MDLRQLIRDVPDFPKKGIVFKDITPLLQNGDALREATASDQPTVLELMVNQELGEPFRRDALKKPVRLLEKYRDYGSG